MARYHGDNAGRENPPVTSKWSRARGMPRHPTPVSTPGGQTHARSARSGLPVEHLAIKGDVACANYDPNECHHMHEGREPKQPVRRSGK